MIPVSLANKIDAVLASQKEETFNLVLHKTAAPRLTENDLHQLIASFKTAPQVSLNIDLGEQHFNEDFIADLHDLQVKTLTIDKVSDKGAAHLAQIETLRQLNIGETTITDEGLAGILNLPHLELLMLAGHEIGEKSRDAILEKANLKIIVGEPDTLADKVRDDILQHTGNRRLGF